MLKYARGPESWTCALPNYGLAILHCLCVLMHVQSASCLNAIYGKPHLPQGLHLHDAYANARSNTKRPRQTPRIVHVGEVDCEYLKTLDGSQRQCVLEYYMLALPAS